MKNYREFLAEQTDKILLFEMPHIQDQLTKRFIDLEFELRLEHLDFDSIIAYLKTWLAGTVYLPKIKAPWIIGGNRGLKYELIDHFKGESEITVPGNVIMYTYNVKENTLWQKTKSEPKLVEPFYITTKEEQDSFIESLAKNNHILAMITALGHTLEELVSQLQDYVTNNPLT